MTLLNLIEFTFESTDHRIAFGLRMIGGHEEVEAKSIHLGVS